MYTLQIKHLLCANNPPLEALIKTAVDGTIKCAHCNCRAGLGVVALIIISVNLFYVKS